MVGQQQSVVRSGVRENRVGKCLRALELTPSDVRAVDDASLVLYLGDGFMPGLETAVRQRQGRSLDVLAELRRERGFAGGAAGDPHVWLDPVRYAEMVRLIGAALGRRRLRRAWPAGSTRSTASTAAASPTARAARS